MSKAIELISVTSTQNDNDDISLQQTYAPLALCERAICKKMLGRDKEASCDYDKAMELNSSSDVSEYYEELLNMTMEK